MITQNQPEPLLTKTLSKHRAYMNGTFFKKQEKEYEIVSGQTEFYEDELQPVVYYKEVGTEKIFRSAEKNFFKKVTVNELTDSNKTFIATIVVK